MEEEKCALYGKGEVMVSGGDGWEAGGAPQILFEGHVMLA